MWDSKGKGSEVPRPFAHHFPFLRLSSFYFLRLPYPLRCAAAGKAAEIKDCEGIEWEMILEANGLWAEGKGLGCGLTFIFLTLRDFSSLSAKGKGK